MSDAGRTPLHKAALTLFAVIAAVSLGVVAGPAVAAPAQPGVAAHAAAKHPIITPVHGGAPAHMGRYGLAQFQGAARTLPSSLDQELRTRLGISSAQFLADGQAAADASQVIASLRQRGVPVTGARMNGTALTVFVANAGSEAAVRAAGATAVVAAAAGPAKLAVSAASTPGDASSPLQGGDLWWYSTSHSSAGDQGVSCSVGFNGFNSTNGKREFVTAGHCADYQATGYAKPLDGKVSVAADATPLGYDDGPLSGLRSIGTLDQSSFAFGGGEDAGLADVTSSSAVTRASVGTWGSTTTSATSSKGSSQGKQSAGSSIAIYGAAGAVTGEPICHSGARTGWQCGEVTRAYAQATVSTSQTRSQMVEGFATSACALEGDSGGSFVSGNYAVGITSGTEFEPAAATGAGFNTCAGDGPSFAYPMVAPATQPSSHSVSTQLPQFQLAVTQPSTTPKLTLDSSGDPTALSGTLAYASGAAAAAGTAVSLSIDGAAAKSTSSAADSSGAQAWTFALSGLSAGAHTYTLTVGTGPSAASRSGTFDAPLRIGTPVITGTAAVGHALTATASASAHATLLYQWYDLGTGTPTSTGTSARTPISGATSKTYTPPASLSGHRLAVAMKAAELGAGVTAWSNPSATLLGGPALASASISGAARVGQTLTATAGGVVPGATPVYQWNANGTPIPGAVGRTLTLVAGQLGAKITVTISGSFPGYLSASKTVAASTPVLPSLARVAGSDRWATAVAASKAQFPNGASTVLIASGANYPDALSAAPAAAKLSGDLLLTAPTSLPPSVASELRRLKPTRVYLVGGTNAISATVATEVRADTGVAPRRVSGTDRYATSAAIAAAFFPSAKTAFAATGAGFPDALSAAGAASSLGAPVLLVPGASSAPTAPVAAQLTRLRPSTLYIVGGTTVVSPALQSTLAKTGTVTRLSGSDRWATSVAVAKKFHPSATQAVVASGANFPDALVGSVLAGSRGAGLLLSSPTCMPGVVVRELTAMHASALTLMGGTAGLSSAVADEKVC
ncbi:cell wall-binding repeat-containing protein [Gryllotalpicola reticulitermitis]|uniref:Cell wall-binding repeat-containing protein n=1 Tax=Gryllotalpicola reticulitermitis TaxID=1184153 RepID=A0ABV8QC99_9MICO